MQLRKLLCGMSILDKLVFKNEVQKVLHELVLVTDPFDHSGRINSLSNFGIIKNQQIQMYPYHCNNIAKD